MDIQKDIEESNEQGLMTYYKALNFQIDQLQSKDKRTTQEIRDLEQFQKALVTTKNRLGTDYKINPEYFDYHNTQIDKLEPQNKVSSLRYGDTYMALHNELQSINDLKHVAKNWEYFKGHNGYYKGKKYSITGETLQFTIPKLMKRKEEIEKELFDRKENDPLNYTKY